MATSKKDLPAYFDRLAGSYGKQTGNSTRELFAQLYDRVAPISSESVIHDNASGPGTALSVLLQRAASAEQVGTIVGTDMVPTMIDALNNAIADSPFVDKVRGVVMDSQQLDFPENHFTHSITNFSVFNFIDPSKAIKEVHRTLQKDGQAIVTTWKYFGAGEIMRTTQRRVRPDLPPLPYSGEDLHSDTALENLLAGAGFDKGSMESLGAVHVVKDEDLVNLQQFMSGGPMAKVTTKSWTDEEKSKWESELSKVVAEEVERSGGVKFEMFAVLVRK